ncbi:MAG TPA: OmpA family protein [Marmoricola sp.]|nr:OmpA family protein [Marmoricola sp.]
MNTPAEEVVAAATTSSTVVSERHRVRRSLPRLFWVVAVVVPLALTALVGLTRGPAIEATLVGQAREALVAEGIKGVGLVADGRRLTARVPTGRDPSKVSQVLSGVSGVSAVKTTDVYANRAEARACAELQRKLDRATDGQRIGFEGSSTRLTASGRQAVTAVAGLLEACRPAVVTVGGHTDGSTYNGPEISLARARAVIDLLVRAGVKRERLEARGYADQFPLVEHDDVASRARNQRVSVVAVQ